MESGRRRQLSAYEAGRIRVGRGVVAWGGVGTRWGGARRCEACWGEVRCVGVGWGGVRWVGVRWGGWNWVIWVALHQDLPFAILEDSKGMQSTAVSVVQLLH